MLKRFGFLPLAVTGLALLVGGLSALAGAGGSGPGILAQNEECGTVTPTATPEQATPTATPEFTPTATPEFTATATPALTATATPVAEEEDEDNEQDQDDED